MALPELTDELSHHQGLEPRAQYLLAALLTGRPVHGGGQRLSATREGTRFLAELTGVTSDYRPDVVADHALRAVPQAGFPNGAVPDVAVFWPGRVVLVEMKTDSATERPGQVDR